MPLSSFFQLDKDFYFELASRKIIILLQVVQRTKSFQEGEFFAFQHEMHPSKPCLVAETFCPGSTHDSMSGGNVLHCGAHRLEQGDVALFLSQPV